MLDAASCDKIDAMRSVTEQTQTGTHGAKHSPYTWADKSNIL